MIDEKERARERERKKERERRNRGERDTMMFMWVFEMKLGTSFAYSFNTEGLRGISLYNVPVIMHTSSSFVSRILGTTLNKD
jgi:hypothetical protein